MLGLQVTLLRTQVSQLERESEDAASTSAQLGQTQQRLQAAQKKLQAVRRQVQMQAQQVRLKEREKEKLKEQLDVLVREDEQWRSRARRTLQDLFPSQGGGGGSALGGGSSSPRVRQKAATQLRKSLGGAGGSRSIQQERQLLEVSRYYEARIAGLQREVKFLAKSLRETEASLEEERQARTDADEDFGTAVVGTTAWNSADQGRGVFEHQSGQRVTASFRTTTTPPGALKAYAMGEDLALLPHFRGNRGVFVSPAVSPAPPSLVAPSPCQLLDYGSAIERGNGSRRSRSLGASFTLASSEGEGERLGTRFSASCFAGFSERCRGRRDSTTSSAVGGQRAAADGREGRDDADRYRWEIRRLRGAVESLSKTNEKVKS